MPAEAPPAPTTQAAPAAAPAAPSPNATPAAPSAAPASRPATDMADAYSQLDAMAGIEPEAKPEEQPDPQKGEQKKGKEVEAPEKVEQTDKGKPGEKPVKAATLRENYDRLKKDFDGLQNKLKTMETERATPQDPKDHPEFKKVAETLAEREKRLADLENEMRFTNFEKSEEYREKYWKPFASAYEAGRNKTASFKLVDAETGKVRQGGAEDFDALMRVTDDDAAAEMAADLFGNKAPMVMYHRERVQEANQTRLAALDTFKKEGGEREKQRGEMMQKHQAETRKLWETEKNAAVERFPKLFKPEDGDERGNALLKRGFELADAAFGGPLTDEKTGEPVQMTPQEMVKLHGAIRNKAAGFDRMVHKYQTAQKTIKELQTQLKQYQDSEPTPGEGSRRTKTPPGSALDAADAELMKLAR